jgi:hypothetical protein
MRHATATTPRRPDFKITVPHSDHDWHQWFFPNGWSGVGPVEDRDRAGRARGKREGFFPSWFVLMCNNPDCPGRAVVPVSMLIDHADECDPQVTTTPPQPTARLA